MNIAIDLGKWKSYVVVEEDNRVVKEGYTETSKEGFEEFMGPAKGATIIVEASSSTNRVANIFDGYNLVVANPVKVRVIAESVKKTDKIDAHTLLDLYKKEYLPISWLPDKETRRIRDICRNQDFLGRQRTAVKNRIRYQAYVLGINFKNFGKKIIKELKNYPALTSLLNEFEGLNKIISDVEKEINEEVQRNHNAQLLDTIPGVGMYSALAIASEIGDVSRFKEESKIFAAAGFTPRIYQSGDREYKGHIVKGNVYLKTLLLQCVQTHIKFRPDSFISASYRRISIHSGSKKIAKIAAARRLLQVMYFMLKRDEKYRTND